MTEKTATDAALSDSSVYEHLRRNPRFKASDDRPMIVVIQRAAGCEPRELRGTILDLSLGGAKLALTAEIGLQEKITVRWDVEHVGRDFTVSGTVCWARTAGGNAWRLGCSFDQQLPDTLIVELAAHGYIDRRQSGRETVTVPATVQWELTQDVVLVRVQDVSAGGFCILCEEYAPTDARCRLIFGTADGETVAVPARVEWQRKTDSGYLLGCAYLEVDAYRVVERVIGRQLTARPVASQAGAQNAQAMAAKSRAHASRRDPDSPHHAARRARRTLLAAILGIGGSLAFIQFGPAVGPLGWAAAGLAMLAGATSTFRYHRLAEEALTRAALQAGRAP